MSTLVTVLDYRPGVKGSRVGFVDVLIPAVGLRLRGCILHHEPTSGTTWVQIPASVLQNEDGLPVAGFPDKTDLHRLTDEVVRQIAEKFGGAP